LATLPYRQITQPYRKIRLGYFVAENISRKHEKYLPKYLHISDIFCNFVSSKMIHYGRRLSILEQAQSAFA
jgi:hypothetical protein